MSLAFNTFTNSVSVALVEKAINKLKSYLNQKYLSSMSVTTPSKTSMPEDIDSNERTAQQSTATTSSTSPTQPIERHGMKGLDNLGQTCYMNSTLQVLYAIPEVASGGARQLPSPVGMARKPMLLHESLHKVFHAMVGSDNNICESVNPEIFWSAFVNYRPDFCRDVQYDAQEFLRFLIDGLHSEVNVVKQRPANGILQGLATTIIPDTADRAWRKYRVYVDNSYLANLFVGQYRSTIRCHRCGHSSRCWDCFWDISLPVPDVEEDLDVGDCLAAYIRPEPLLGDAMPRCERCLDKWPATKSMSFERVPPILIIHLKKFDNNGHKIMKNVRVNSRLVVNGRWYTLFACVSHNGSSSSSGHYVAYCRHRDQWFSFDDECVRRQVSIDWNHMSGAYILFYRYLQ